MPPRTRLISEQQCAWLADDLQNLINELSRIRPRHREFSQNIWLGGSQDANNYEEPPVRCRRSMDLLRRAQDLVQQADHVLAMFRAVGDNGVEEDDNARDS